MRCSKPVQSTQEGSLSMQTIDSLLAEKVNFMSIRFLQTKYWKKPMNKDKRQEQDFLDKASCEENFISLGCIGLESF